MLNDCAFIGNLGNDPEARAAKNGGNAFTTFSIAVNKPSATREDKPLWVNVTAFGKVGESVAANLKKGSRVYVQGALEVSEYEGKDGKNHVSVKLLSNKVVFLDKRETGTGAPTQTSKPAAASAGVTDEDIPF